MRTHKIRAWAAAAALTFSAAAAHAGNGITNVTVLKEPNLTSAAITCIVTGDDDSSATGRIFQRIKGASVFDTGQVMVRRVGGGGSDDAHSGNMYSARIVDMIVGQTIDFYCEFNDGGGGFTTSADTISCRPVRQLVATGPVYYADAVNGDDGNPGNFARPTRTIDAALTALSQSTNHGKNGGVFVRPGVYHERVTLDPTRFPTDGDFHFLEGDGQAPELTIMDGGSELVDQGRVGPNIPLRWTNTFQDSVWMAYFPMGDSTQLVVIGWNEILHRKTSMLALLNDSTYAYVFGSTNAGELSGWWWQNDTLYIKRRNGQGPGGAIVHTGYRDDAIAVQRRNWRIARMTIRYFGATSFSTYRADVDPGQNGVGIILGSGGTASSTVIDSMAFYGLNASAIQASHWSGGFVADSVVVANTTVDEGTIGGMDYFAGKQRAEEDAGQIVLASRAACLYKSSIANTFNGVQTGFGSITVGASDSTAGSQCEIYGNTITGTSDDAIELDTSHNINTLVSHNTVRNCSSGISLTPTFSGPTYVLYNLFANSIHRGVKAGGGTTGVAVFADNTITSSVAGCAALDFASGGAVNALTFWNNILIGTQGGGVNSVVLGASALGSNSFNFNFIDGIGVTYLASWAGINYSTLSGLQAGTGWETNGVSPGVAFVDSTRANWSLKSTSPALNAGRRITGINAGLNGTLYQVGPEIGSEERILP